MDILYIFGAITIFAFVALIWAIREGHQLDHMQE